MNVYMYYSYDLFEIMTYLVMQSSLTYAMLYVWPCFHYLYINLMSIFDFISQYVYSRLIKLLNIIRQYVITFNILHKYLIEYNTIHLTSPYPHTLLTPHTSILTYPYLHLPLHTPTPHLTYPYPTIPHTLTTCTSLYPHTLPTLTSPYPHTLPTLTSPYPHTLPILASPYPPHLTYPYLSLTLHTPLLPPLTLPLHPPHHMFTVYQAKERRAELQKYRVLLSYKQAKACQQKKIKSKKYVVFITQTHAHTHTHTNTRTHTYTHAYTYAHYNHSITSQPVHIRNQHNMYTNIITKVLLLVM